ncbi:MAG: hypothetical protein IKU10_02725, partial [Clostridia bacterium]|nr:hypothetical protein [Clostridia bacterium]
MKTNITRILCLALVLMMAVAVFAGCSKKDDVTETDVTNTDVISAPEDIIIDTEGKPYDIVQDASGKDIVILKEDGLYVAEDTTLEAFLACVVAKEGYTVKVTSVEGEEVTDTKATIVDGMTFDVLKDGVVVAEETQKIVVVTEEEIESTVQQQIKIEKQQAIVSKQQ